MILWCTVDTVLGWQATATQKNGLQSGREKLIKPSPRAFVSNCQYKLTWCPTNIMHSWLQFLNYQPPLNHWHVTTEQTISWQWGATTGLKRGRTQGRCCWKSGGFQLNPPQSHVWDGDLRYKWMGAKNRPDLLTTWWARGRANKQNMMWADQLACIRVITQRRADEPLWQRIGIYLVCTTTKMEQRVRKCTRWIKNTMIRSDINRSPKHLHKSTGNL